MCVTVRTSVIIIRNRFIVRNLGEALDTGGMKPPRHGGVDVPRCRDLRRSPRKHCELR